MSTEIIFALVLSSLFLGAITWLVIYSRLQHRKAERTESIPSPAEPKAGEVAAVEVGQRTPGAVPPLGRARRNLHSHPAASGR